jgi:cysteine-rich repeat protein
VDGICRIELVDGGGRCGDGRRDPGEVCDDGNTTSGDGCRADCRSDETCGNGQQDVGEACDDGNTADGDGCRADCRLGACGDGRVDPGEQCDDGNAAAGDGCSAGCFDEVCGNGRRDPGETCDDGNSEDGDGCCACGPCAECGNRVLDPGEACDQGGSTATCDLDCTEVACGDGLQNPAAGEACDDGNRENLDLCTNECAAATCSDGLRNADEVDTDCGGRCGPGTCEDGQICGAPADCASGLCERNRCSAPTRVAFVTSELFDGNLGGVAGADGHCQRLAEAAGLAGSFRAWLSDGTSAPTTRFTRSSNAYVLVDGTVIADSYTDLTDGTLDNPIALTELGTAPPAAFDNSCAGGTPTIFWSATAANGGPIPVPASNRCQDWTSTAGSSNWGNAALFTEPSWSQWCSGGECAWHAPLHCFQQ